MILRMDNFPANGHWHTVPYGFLDAESYTSRLPSLLRISDTGSCVISCLLEIRSIMATF